MKDCTRRENTAMRALYLLAIFFVVDGHLSGRDMLDLGGLFGYYSFHLMLFAFGSGYFFRDGAQDAPGREIARAAGRLLVPLYLWNLVYGVGAALLRRVGGFEIGAQLSAYTLLLAPLADGEHFVYNLGSWFVFPLFMCRSIYVLVRRLSRLWSEREGITFLLLLIPGAVCVELCFAGSYQALPLWLMRTLILLPGYAGGVLYRRVLEKRDTMKTVPYLLGIVALRLLLFIPYDNLSYLLSNCTYYPCGAFGVYAGGALAIAFWLRIARLIAPYVEKSRLALYASRHTFDIMMHHYMGFFAVNGFFLGLHMLGAGAADFSVHALRTVSGYAYLPQGREEFAWLYLAAGMLLPLAVRFVQDKLLTIKKAK